MDATTAVIPPQSDQPGQPFPATNLTAHDNHFKPSVGILPG